MNVYVPNPTPNILTLESDMAFHILHKMIRNALFHVGQSDKQFRCLYMEKKRTTRQRRQCRRRPWRSKNDLIEIHLKDEQHVALESEQYRSI